MNEIMKHPINISLYFLYTHIFNLYINIHITHIISTFLTYIIFEEKNIHGRYNLYIPTVDGLILTSHTFCYTLCITLKDEYKTYITVSAWHDLNYVIPF